MAGHTTAGNPSDSRPSSASKPASVQSSKRNKRILYTALLAGVFLLGLVPQYLQANRMSQEVQRLTWQNQIATARDHAGLMFLEVTNNNFGVASSHGSKLFDHVRQMIERAKVPAEIETLRQIAAKRDSVTAGLAKADPAVRSEVQEVVSQTHQLGVRQ